MTYWSETLFSSGLFSWVAHNVLTSISIAWQCSKKEEQKVLAKVLVKGSSTCCINSLLSSDDLVPVKTIGKAMTTLNFSMLFWSPEWDPKHGSHHMFPAPFYSSTDLQIAQQWMRDPLFLSSPFALFFPVSHGPSFTARYLHSGSILTHSGRWTHFWRSRWCSNVSILSTLDWYCAWV